MDEKTTNSPTGMLLSTAEAPLKVQSVRVINEGSKPIPSQTSSINHLEGNTDAVAVYAGHEEDNFLSFQVISEFL